MGRVLVALVCGLSVALGAGSLASAENRSIKDLPDDVARWSTIWGEIPAQMYEENVDNGPVAAVTVGPARGAAEVVRKVGSELLVATHGDKRPGHSSPMRKKDAGPIFRYEF